MSSRGMKGLKRFIIILEVIISLIIAIAVIMGIPDLFRYIVVILSEPKNVSYEAFGSFFETCSNACCWIRDDNDDSNSFS